MCSLGVYREPKPAGHCALGNRALVSHPIIVAIDENCQQEREQGQEQEEHEEQQGQHERQKQQEQQEQGSLAMFESELKEMHAPVPVLLEEEDALTRIIGRHAVVLVGIFGSKDPRRALACAKARGGGGDDWLEKSSLPPATSHWAQEEGRQSPSPSVMPSAASLGEGATLTCDAPISVADSPATQVLRWAIAVREEVKEWRSTEGGLLDGTRAPFVVPMPVRRKAAVLQMSEEAEEILDGGIALLRAGRGEVEEEVYYVNGVGIVL